MRKSVFTLVLASAIVMSLSASSFARMNGPKKLVAVSKFDNKTSWRGQVNIGDGMSEMLTDALMQSGNFIVLERQDIEGVLEEQNFGASGRTTSQGGAKIGKINRAQILIKGAITEYSASKSGGGQGLNIKGFSIGGSSNKGHVAVIIYLYDTTTGQVIASQRCEGTADSGGMKVGFTNKDWGLKSGGHKSTPIEKATQMAIDKAVSFISAKMSRVPWQGRIIKADNSKIYLNVGSAGGINVGDEFNVYQEGEALVDPDTGLNLGSEATRIGRVQVVQVKDKFSIATPVSGANFEKNNIVRFE